MFEDFFYYLTVFLSVLMMIYFFYTIVLAFAGLKPQKSIPKHEAAKRFACVIPAHNEANVIGDLVDSLKNQDYPSDYSIFTLWLTAVKMRQQ